MRSATAIAILLLGGIVLNLNQPAPSAGQASPFVNLPPQTDMLLAESIESLSRRVADLESNQCDCTCDCQPQAAAEVPPAVQAFPAEEMVQVCNDGVCTLVPASSISSGTDAAVSSSSACAGGVCGPFKDFTPFNGRFRIRRR